MRLCRRRHPGAYPYKVEAPSSASHGLRLNGLQLKAKIAARVEYDDDPEAVAVTDAELDVIHAASAALPPPQRRAFSQMVTDRLANLPCGVMGPGTLHRVIAACDFGIE